MSVFFTVLTQPMINILTILYHYIPDLGVGIIILTVFIKLILFYFNWKSLKSQKEMRDLQDKMNKIKETIPDQEKQAEEIMKIYKQGKVNPLSSCLPLIIQLVVLIALIKTLNGFMLNQVNIGGGNIREIKEVLYAPVSRLIGDFNINYISFGFLNLTQKALSSFPSATSFVGIGLALLAGITQFLQTKLTNNLNGTTKKKKDEKELTQEEQITNSLNTQMLYVFPALTIWMGMSFPIGITLYWVISTVFSVLQQLLLNSMQKKEKNNTSNVNEKKIIDIEKQE